MLIPGIMLTITAVFLLVCYICYRIAFYAAPRKPRPERKNDGPKPEKAEHPQAEEGQEKLRRRKPYYHNRRRRPKGEGGAPAGE